MFAWFFLSALYLQLVLHRSPLQVGLSFLPANLIMGAFSLGLSAKLVMRYGFRAPLAVGLVAAALALIWLARAPVHGSFLVDVLPAMLLFVLAALTIAVADVDEAAGRFARFTGRAATPCEGGQTIGLDRGRLEIVTMEAISDRFPEVAVPSLPFMGACTIAVGSLAAAEGALRRGGIAYRRGGDQVIARFPDELGTGVWVFTP